jgi:hypothetical protein
LEDWPSPCGPLLGPPKSMRLGTLVPTFVSTTGHVMACEASSQSRVQGGWIDPWSDTCSVGEILWILPPRVGSSFQKWERRGKHQDNPGKQQYMFHGTRDHIWALILELGPGWPDRPNMVRTRSDGEIWWKCQRRWVPRTKTGKTCKTPGRPRKQENMCHGTCEDI